MSNSALLQENLARVHERIAQAVARSGRSPGSVQLVAVTKGVPFQFVSQLVEAGCTLLAESRPQELWAKAASLDNPAVRWHLIGHLQRNKIRRTLPLVDCLQSLDSLRLLEAVHAEAAAAGRTIDALLEINISGDPNKTGLPPAELEPLLQQAPRFSQVRIRGLMGMASLEGDDRQARLDFRRLRELAQRAAASCPPQVSLVELSMGMSHDFEIAIEEGATMVRVGSALFDHVTLDDWPAA